METRRDEEIKILAYIHGELDERERATVEREITECEETRALFNKLYHEHLKIRWGTRAQLIQTDYPTFKARMKPRRRILVSAAAAVAVLFIGITILFLHEKSNIQEQPLHLASEIQPGSFQAILTLSTGQTIPIADLTTEIREQHGINIQIKQNGIIQYPQLKFKDSAQLKPIYNYITTPRGGEFVLDLSDGTKVWLNSDSRIDFPVQFTGKQREVWLTQGEAYFDVAHDSLRPFIVHLKEDINLRVYGTAFNANTHDPRNIQVVLVDGSVGISKGGEQKMLKPNQKAEYSKELDRITISDTDVTPYIAWKDGNFIFNNETLESILDRLSLWYDFDVFYVNKDLRNIRLSGDMKKYDDIGKLLYFFEQISEVKFSIKGKCLTVDYK